MVALPNNGNRLFALDTIYRDLGLGQFGSVRPQTVAERRANISEFDFNEPIVLTGTGFDPDGQQLVTLTSHTSYDKETGLFQDKIFYWRHLPGDENMPGQNGDTYVLAIECEKDPSASQSQIPKLLPKRIFVNGKPVFDSSKRGKRGDPYTPENRRLIDSLFEVSKRVKERLHNHRPVEDVAQDIAGGLSAVNMTKAVTGKTPILRGLDPEGGFNSTENLIMRYFGDACIAEDMPLSFRLPEANDQSPIERLKSALGFRKHSLEISRQLSAGRGETGVDFQSGIRYVTGSDYFHDRLAQKHIFTISITPENPPQDVDCPEPFDVVKLEFTQDVDTFTLSDYSFMNGDKSKFSSWRERYRLLQLLIESNHYLADKEFPPFRDIIARNNLLEFMNEFHIPPSLEEEGGEFLWIPMNGCSLEAKVDIFGKDIGGGHMFMHRGVKPDGRVSEVTVVQDFPLAIGGPNSDYDGAQPDFLPYMESIRKGVIVLSHDHFDHASLEYYAKMGWLKGQKVLCDDRVADIVKGRLNNLGVEKEDFPIFINERHKTVKALPDGNFSYPVKDEDGITRIWVQFCPGGSQHSSLTTSHLITGCYGDDHYNDTYYLDNDALGLTEKGWAFAETGQLSLSALEEVSEDKLIINIKDPEKLYISLEDTTNITKSGNATTPEEFKDTIRQILRAMPDDNAVAFSSFSTNHLEIQAITEVFAEEDTLRNWTTIGANMEVRAGIMNKHGVNPDLDLRSVEIPHDKIPQSAYDVALEALKAAKDKREELAAKKADKRSEKRTVKQILQSDVTYKVFRHILGSAKKSIKAGDPKPQIIHDCFFNDDDMAFENIAVNELGAPAAKQPRSMGGSVKRAMDKHRKDLQAKLLETGKERVSDTEFWMIRSLAKYGKIHFKNTCSHNEYAMYQAIMAGQETAARHAGRDSKTARSFRNDYGKLGLIVTGPTGTMQEHFATLSKFADKRSLLDDDEAVSSTGYKVDASKMAIFITQPPSMGQDAALAQQALIQRVIENRGCTVILANDTGFKIYNPKEHLSHYQQAFQKLGWKPKYNGQTQTLEVRGHSSHISGHRRRQDLVDKFTDKRFKAKLVEFIHIPSWRNFMEGKLIAKETGKPTSIEKPDNFRAHKFSDGNGQSEPRMKVTDYLTPSYWLINLERKFGLQYGGVVNMMRATIMNRRGSQMSNGLDVRTDGKGFYQEQSVSKAAGDLPRALSHNFACARARASGPSTPDLQIGGGRPKTPPASRLLANQRHRRLAMGE